MKVLAACAVPLALSLSAGVLCAQSAPAVVLDGAMDDWRGTPAVLTDPADAPASYADVVRVQATHDAEAVYLALEVERPVALQGMRGTLVLLLDADGDPASGRARHGMQGVDAAIEFSAPLGEGGARMGIGLRMPDSAGTPALVTANAAEVTVAPSHLSRWFELRIPRCRALPFRERMTARLVSLDAADAVVDETEAFTLDLRNPPPRPPSRGAGAADPLARAPGTDFRVVSWNVGRQGLFERPDAFGALLRPLAPDLLLFDEVAGGHSAGEVEALLNRVLPGDRPWHAVYGTSGGSQRGVIALRGAAPVVPPAFAGTLPYPDSTTAIIPADSEEAAAWLQSRLDSRVPVTGAVVELGGRRLLAVTVDLESGGTPGGPRDRLRRIEALAIRDALAAAVRAGGMDGVLVAGDLNQVASTDPLEILSAGPDVDGSALHVPLPLRLDDASAATWERAEEVFTPSRLDFVLVGDAALAVTGGFIFRAADLSPAWRARHGVAVDASRVTDHLPVVTDLRWVAAPR